MATEAFYTDPAGNGHRVTVIERGKKMTSISYFDNTRRGVRHAHGRIYNHATCVRVKVWNHELREAR